MAPGPELAARTLDAAGRTNSVNGLNRIHIDFEDIATPLETASLKASESTLPELSRQWLARLTGFVPTLASAPQRYQRIDHQPGVVVFDDPSIRRRRKNCLIAFSGAAGRLMLPLPVFLQFLPSAEWTVVKLATRKNYYLDGIAGFSDSLEETIDRVDALMKLRSYRKVVTIGTSSGGFAALAAAVRTGAFRGIALGAFVPKVEGDALHVRLARLGLPQKVKDQVDLRIVYAARAALDRDHARQLRKLVRGHLVPLEDLGQHNVLFSMLERGELAGFMARLGGDWPL